MSSPEDLKFPFSADKDGAAILDIEHDAIVTLNATGGYVWQRLKRHDSLEAIVHDIAEETGIDRAVVDADVHHFVRQLKARGLFHE